MAPPETLEERVKGLALALEATEYCVGQSLGPALVQVGGSTDRCSHGRVVGDAGFFQLVDPEHQQGTNVAVLRLHGFIEQEFEQCPEPGIAA